MLCIHYTSICCISGVIYANVSCEIQFNWIELKMKNANENETQLANETNAKLWVNWAAMVPHIFMVISKWNEKAHTHTHILNVKIEFSQKLYYTFSYIINVLFRQFQCSICFSSVFVYEMPFSDCDILSARHSHSIQLEHCMIPTKKHSHSNKTNEKKVVFVLKLNCTYKYTPQFSVSFFCLFTQCHFWMQANVS